MSTSSPMPLLERYIFNPMALTAATGRRTRVFRSGRTWLVTADPDCEAPHGCSVSVDGEQMSLETARELHAAIGEAIERAEAGR